jgi:hypothetical protein
VPTAVAVQTGVDAKTAFPVNVTEFGESKQFTAVAHVFVVAAEIVVATVCVVLASAAPEALTTGAT